VLIRDLARQVAHDVHVERRLFEILGAWSTSVEEPEVARVFAIQSRHHGEHAGWLAALTPVLHDVDAASVAPTAALDVYLDAVAATGNPAARLRVLVEVVLPELTSGYDALLASTDDVADAPLRRALRLVVQETGDDWRAATAVLRGGLRAEGDAGEEAAHQSRLQVLARDAR
jgi:hypothetical protein